MGFEFFTREFLDSTSEALETSVLSGLEAGSHASLEFLGRFSKVDLDEVEESSTTSVMSVVVSPSSCEFLRV